MNILKRSSIIILCFSALVACNDENEDVKLARKIMQEMEAGSAAEKAYNKPSTLDPATKAARIKVFCEKEVARAIATKDAEQLAVKKKYDKTCFEYYP